jgi:hypothetical protein
MTGANHARWTGYFKTAEPRIGDELGTWTKLQLEKMDADFVAAMRGAIARGKERPPIVHQIVHLIGASARRVSSPSAPRRSSSRRPSGPCSSF